MDLSSIQSFLNTQGFRLVVDGLNGPATTRALMAFQIAHGLRGDGMWGPNTEAVAKGLGFGAAAAPVPVSGVLDARSTEILSHVHPKLAERVKALISFAAADGYTLHVTQGLRTFPEQDALYAQGRTRKGPEVTAAKGGESNHNYGLAVDVAFLIDGKISFEDKYFGQIGAWAAKSNLAWGGNWRKKDLPHVELPNVAKWPVLRGWYREGGLPTVWSKY